MKITFLGRAESLSALNLPFFASGVAAGFPSPAQDYIEQRLDLNELCISHPAATYLVRAMGDSMQGDGIFNGDILVVDRSMTASHGDVVIVALEGEFTVKRLYLHPRPCLRASHPDYPPVLLDQDSALEIFGVVTYCIHELKH